MSRNAGRRYDDLVDSETSQRLAQFSQRVDVLQHHHLSGPEAADVVDTLADGGTFELDLPGRIRVAYSPR